jgi:DNA (cytosine-5)-methyltransferase 1
MPVVCSICDSKFSSKIKLVSHMLEHERQIIFDDDITFIEVCAGAGGLSCGLIKAGFTPILLNDNNADCCKTLELNHPGITVSHCSMTDLKINGTVDLLCGGVPCQSFSQAGARKGLEDPRGNLMIEFSKLIDNVKPKVFMIENVKGLMTHDKGETLKIIIETLNNSKKYDIKYKLLNSLNFGVPQKRERVFIIGVLKSLNKEYKFPEPEKKIFSVGDALKNVPESPCAKYNEEKIELYKLIPQGGCWVNLPEHLQKSYLGNSYNSGGGKRGILHRLSMDKPSLTILCSPSQKQTERCHPLHNRPLSVRETARIQTFEDSYEFVGSMSSQYKQVGNAVPVELAARVGKSIIDLLRSY